MGHKHSGKSSKKHKEEKSWKKKKEKKRKKHRKETKSKRKSHSSSSSSSSNSRFSDEDATLNKELGKVKEEKEWGFLDAALKESNVFVKEKQSKAVRPSLEEGLGQSSRELNPYWKNGGCGLPPEEKAVNRNPQEGSLGLHSNANEMDRKSYLEGAKFLKPGESSNYSFIESRKERNWKRKEISEEGKVAELTSKEEKQGKAKPVLNVDLNKLASKLVKAEIMGDAILINKLKSELEAAKKLKEAAVEEEETRKSTVVILSENTFKRKESQESVPSKRLKVKTHDSSGRLCYFPDDDKYSLKTLFEKEKFGGIDAGHCSYTSKLSSKNLDEMDDIYVDSAGSGKMQAKAEEKRLKKEKRDAVKKHKSIEGCCWCLDNRNNTRHLIVSLGIKSYLCLPEEESLVDGHCMIVPLNHEVSGMKLDEDVWSEIKSYQKAISQMFLSRKQDVIFFENARAFNHFPHCIIHCIPLDKEVGDVAPIYFQKAISESETEWSNNKKVIDFRNKDLRRSIPKDLPYFAVSFGTEGGFAHIIEDEFLFKKSFAQEVLGGMLDLEPAMWRKPKKQDFKTQREKALSFLKLWNKFEFNDKSPQSQSEASDSE